MKDPKVNISLNIPLSMYQWLDQAAEKNQRTIGQEAKARLMEIFLREADDRRKHSRTTG
jgi:hypothetical protein